MQSILFVFFSNTLNMVSETYIYVNNHLTGVIRNSQVVCKAATNASSGDIPESPPSGMSQYEREDCIQLKEKIL